VVVPEEKCGGNPQAKKRTRIGSTRLTEPRVAYLAGETISPVWWVALQLRKYRKKTKQKIGGQGAFIPKRYDIDESKKKDKFGRARSNESCARVISTGRTSQRDHARWYQERQHAGRIGQRSVNDKYSTENTTKLLTRPPAAHHGLLIPASIRSISRVQLQHQQKKQLTPLGTCTQPQMPSQQTGQASENPSDAEQEL